MIRSRALSTVAQKGLLSACRRIHVLYLHRHHLAPGITRHLSLSAPFDKNQYPPLKEIRSLPLVGSIVSSYSGLPPLHPDKLIAYWRQVFQEHGPFVKCGMPGMGSGLFSTVYVVRDPKEMMKVLQQEGKYPNGVLTKEWPLHAWLKKKNSMLTGFFGRGEEWKRIRSFMQKDLLAPASAKEYLPGILRGAATMSPKAASFAEQNDLHQFLNYTALSMFMEVLYGGQGGMSDDDFEKFCKVTTDAMAQLFDLIRSPRETIAYHLGLKTELFQQLFDSMDAMDEIARRRYEIFVEKFENDNLTLEERNSYMCKILQRQTESDMTADEVAQLAVLLMFVGVDTTSIKTSWNVLQLALNPGEQEKLHQFLDSKVRKEGRLTPNALTEVPLLSAFIRETHRVTPVVPADLVKEIAVPTEVYGVTLPAGSTIVFDCLTDQWDPAIVKDPMEFRPERWLKENVEARQNTPAAIVDHAFYSGPFSQGARRCPGSRVAKLEIQSLLAQLLLDWRIEGPDMHWSEVPSKLQMFMSPVFPEGIRFVPRTE